MIGDNISVRVLYTHPTLGELEVATHNNYSVKKYCLNMMNAGAAALKMTAEQYAALTTLVADTLEYGAKVQLYRGYHTDALVNEGITGQSTFVPLTDAYAAGKVSTTTAADGTKLSGASAVLDNTIRLRFSFVTSDVSRVTLKIGNTVYDSDDFVATGAMSGGLPVYSVNSAPLSAHQMEDIFALSLCVDGVEVQSYAYGVVNYLYSKQNDGSALLSDLIHSIRNYGLSAVAYRAAMGQ